MRGVSKKAKEEYCKLLKDGKYGKESMQKKMHATLRSKPDDVLQKALNKRRLRLGLGLPWGNPEGIIGRLRKENVMVRAHWLKTVMDSWFTETRYPLTCRNRGCIFGCNLLRHPRAVEGSEKDDIHHYLRCPQLKILLEVTLGVSDIMIDVSALVGQTPDGFDPKLLSTMFATYHGFKLGYGSRSVKFPTSMNILGKIEETVSIIARKSLFNTQQSV